MAENDDPFAAIGGSLEYPDQPDPFAGIGDTLEYSDPVEDYEGGGFYNTVKGIRNATSFVADSAQGILTSPITMIQGILELGSSGFDLAFDTDTTSSVSDTFNAVNDWVVPESSAGQVANQIGAFGLGFIPVAGWLNRANASAKGLNVTSKSRYMRTAEDFGRSGLGQKVLGNRAKLIGTTAVAYGGYGYAFSPDGRATLSDSVDWLPDALETEETAGLEGRERALATLRNKGRNATEDMLMSLGFDAAIAGVGAGMRTAAPYIGDAINTAKENSAVQTTFNALNNVTSSGPAVAAKRKFQAFFSPDQGVDPLVMEAKRNAQAKVSGEKAIAADLVGELDNTVRRFVKASGVQGTNGARNPDQVWADLNNYLDGNISSLPAGYPAKAQELADDILQRQAKLFDEVSYELEQIVKNDPGVGPRSIEAEKVRFEMLNNQNQNKNRLRRVFDVHRRPLDFYKGFDINDPRLSRAIREVGLNQRRMNGINRQGALTATEEATARKTVLESLGLYSANNRMTLDQALDAKIKSLEEIAQFSRGEKAVKPRGADLRADEGLFIERQKLLDKSPTLRSLMGEIKDPKDRVIETIDSIASTAASMRFYSDVYAKNTKSFGSAITAIENGGRPLVIEVPDRLAMNSIDYRLAMAPLEQRAMQESARLNTNVTANEMLQQYQRDLVEVHGYVKLGSMSTTEGKARSIIGGEFGELSGKYVPREMYDALTSPRKMEHNALRAAVALTNSAVGQVQRATVILNPASRIRDMIGSTGMVFGSGNLMRDMDIAGNIQLAFNSFKNLDDIGLRAKREQLEMAGVRDSNVVLQLLKQFRTESEQLGQGAISSKLVSAGQSINNMPVYRQINKAFEDVAAGTDLLMKVTALTAEEQKLRAIYAKAGLDVRNPAAAQALIDAGLATKATNDAVFTITPRGQAGSLRPTLTRSQALDPVEVIAAQRVRSMLPNYGMVGTGVRQGYERAPVIGNFTSFAFETIRNSVNILDTGMKELSFKLSDDAAAAIRRAGGNPEQFQSGVRAEGLHRLSSYVAMASVIPKQIQRASMIATGTTEDDIQAAKRLGPEYLSGVDLIVTKNDGEGKMELINLNQTAPYAFALEGAQAAIEAYAETGDLGGSTIKQISDATIAGVVKYFEPFLAPTIITDRVLDVSPARGGRTAEGARIYGESDSLSDKVVAGMYHVTDAFLPGYARLAVTGRGGEISPGNVTRAVQGIPSRQGDELSQMEEFGKILTGATPIRIDAFKQGAFKAEEYSTTRSDARGVAIRKIKRPDQNKDQMIGAWQEYTDKLYRAQSKMYGDVQAMRALGLTDQQIRVALIEVAEEGTREVNSIMRGEFYPGFYSRDAAAKLRREISEGYDNRLVMEPPIEEMREISRSRFQEKLDPLRFAKESVEGDPFADIGGGLSQDGDPFAGIGANLSYEQPVETAPAQPVGPVTYQPPAPPAPAGPVPNELLGGNPFEQMRNAPLQSLRPVARP